MENKPFKIEKIEKIIDNKETVDLEECLKKLEVHFESIGEGGNAIVYVASGTAFEKICFKLIKQKPQIDYNKIDQEHEYQIKVREAGVRTPMSLMSFTTEEKEEYLVMEKVNGNTIEEITKNHDLIPQDFDYNTFCKSLDEQISKMHGAGIYHRDLHLRNVMINNEGLPVIIDFGTATEGTGSDNTYEEGVKMYSPQKGRYDFVTGYFKDDLQQVKNLKSELKVFMKG